MNKKNKIYYIFSFIVLCVCFITQVSFADIVFIPETRGTVSSTWQKELLNQISWATIINTNTGRYLRPEIQKDTPLTDNTNDGKPAIDIPNTDIINTFQTSNNYQEAHAQIRILFLQQMISKGFARFVSKPFQDANEKFVLLTNTWFADFVLLEDIQLTDSLDALINKKIGQYKNMISNWVVPSGLYFTQDEYATLHDVYMFKSNEDLYKLWYELVSYRYRTNKDAEYRRHNISLAFSKIGNIRVINPNETFSFQDTIRDTDQSTPEWKFKAGPAIVEGKIVNLYGWWLCGASTAFYQWILTNTALEITQRSPHTKRYASLYDSFVNGEAINMPGLDSTVFTTAKDIKIINKRTYPLIVVLNYDGSVWWTEEVFSLAKISDKWSLVYKGKSKKKCYIREVNGEDVSSCYQQIF